MKKIYLILTTLFIVISVSAQIDTNDFVTTWKTDNPGISNDSSIKIYTDPNYTYNYDIDWDNDGVFDSIAVTNDIRHTYSSPGTYTIRIRGIFPSVKFGGSFLDEDKIISIDQWGNILFANMSNAFISCINLGYTATDKPNFDNNCNLNGMFSGAHSFNGNIGNWDVSSVISTNQMFSGASSFNQNLNNWDMSSVTDMEGMFKAATSFNQPLNNWDVSAVIDMTNMFQQAISFNQSIDSWNVSSVTSMFRMFEQATAFNQDLNSWDVSSVTNTREMFREANSFNGNINNWDVSSVINMEAMLAGINSSFDKNLANWDIQPGTQMNYLLSGSNLSITNYDSTLIAWQAKSHPINVIFYPYNLKYCLSDSARALLIADGWDFTGDSLNCLGVSIEEEQLKNKLSIYPNPSSGTVNVETEEEIRSIRVFNLQGKLIQSIVTQRSVTLSEVEVGVEVNTKQFSLPEKSGLYLIKIETEKGQVLNRKVIRN